VINDTITIREIERLDNKDIEAIIRSCFYEFELPLTGTAYEDSDTKNMFESYQNTHEVYYVVEENGEVLGGAGIKPLKSNNIEICEFNKMYFSPKVRGKGMGKALLDKCLQAAKQMGYKQCYIESDSRLKAAIHIYESFGFKHLQKGLEGTGHFSCGVWMIKDL